jgi:hypothetical protein
LKYRATGLAGQFSASQKSCDGMSSPWGEETGEGGRKYKSRNPPKLDISRKSGGDKDSALHDAGRQGR